MLLQNVLIEGRKLLANWHMVNFITHGKYCVIDTLLTLAILEVGLKSRVSTIVCLAGSVKSKS
jgi:hypothetical protein